MAAVPNDPESVAAMIRDAKAPTAPLDDFLTSYGEDDNVWWMIGCGHHMNLFEAAVERILELEALLLAMRESDPSSDH